MNRCKFCGVECEFIEKCDYWKKRCELAEKLIDYLIYDIAIEALKSKNITSNNHEI